MKSTSGLSICPRNCRAYALNDSTYRRWPSAKIVSNARLDFPEPDSPVKTMRLSRGRSRSTPRRLCSRAPRTTSRGASVERAAACGASNERSTTVGSLQDQAVPFARGPCQAFERGVRARATDGARALLHAKSRPPTTSGGLTDGRPASGRARRMSHRNLSDRSASVAHMFDTPGFGPVVTARPVSRSARRTRPAPASRLFPLLPQRLLAQRRGSAGAGQAGVAIRTLPGRGRPRHLQRTHGPRRRRRPAATSAG